MPSKKLDTKKPFSVMIYDQGALFGLVCTDESGTIAAKQTAEEFVKERKDMMEEYSKRSFTWSVSTVIFGITMPFKAITVDNQDHLIELCGKDNSFSLKRIGNAAGKAVIMQVPKENFEERLKSGLDVGF